MYFTSFQKLYKGLIFENKLPGSMIDNIFDIFSKGNYKLFIRGLFTLFPNLITKESYNWWVTRRFWGFRQQISKAKYLKMSVANIWKLQEKPRGTVQNWLRNSPGKRYQRIRICLIGEVETPSSPIRM